MKLELKNFRSGFGHDQAGWQGTLYVDGIRTAVIDDDGWGGELMYAPYDETKLAEARTYCEALPPLETEYGQLDNCLAIQLDQVIELADLKKSSRGATILKEGEQYSTLKGRHWRRSQLTPEKITRIQQSFPAAEIITDFSVEI